jgi:hypothetical protein
MAGELENQLADFIRGELSPDEDSQMREHLAQRPELRQTADDLRKVLALSKEIAQDEPLDILVAEARESLLRELASIERRQGRHLRLMMLQFQGSWGHGEICVGAKLPASFGSAKRSSGSPGHSECIGEPQEGIGQVPLLKLQIQGSWGHGEGCLPASAGASQI